jgi:SPP1 family predicted phage head-tail adaptor
MFEKLDQRVMLQADTLTPDGGGGYLESWQSFATVWARLEALGAADGFDADKLESRARHKLILRRRSDLAAGQRAVIGSRRFKLHAVLDEGPRAAFVTLLCEELP